MEENAPGRRRVAVCHEWIVTYGGSEQVAQRMAAVAGARDVYTFAADDGLAAELFPHQKVHVVSRVGGSRFGRTRWQWLLPLMPFAWRRADLSAYDMVLTSSHAAVNSIRVASGTPHISYCHTPMRYAWEWRSEIGRVPRLLRPLWPALAGIFRRLDRNWAQKVTTFIANSHFVAGRIKDYYDRDAIVIHPPIDTSYWTPSEGPISDEFLVAGRLVAYKRAHIAVEAANLAGVKLVVAGSGPELERLRDLAGDTVRFVEEPSSDELRDLYRLARALVFPGIEDFGMTPVEAQACGTPVIAYRKGGVLESVVEGKTGTFYDDPSPAGLAAALRSFDNSDYDRAAVRRHAERFDASRFDESFGSVISAA